MTAPVAHCARHPFDAATGACGRCGRPMCARCLRETPEGWRCPECAAMQGADPRPASERLGAAGDGGRGVVTFSLIGANTVVAVLAAASGLAAGLDLRSVLLGGVTPLHLWGALDAASVAEGGWWRPLTSMFLHYGAIHLGMNMLALSFAGRPLEAALGRTRFLLLYLLGGLGGSIAVVLSGTTALTAGASGAIFGLFAALVVVLRRLGRSAGAVLPVIVANLVLTFAVPGISIAGHLGGLVAGAVAALLLTPRARRRGSR
ncbi:rhomboid family intramembrane serine protease [Homoserinibacter sp. YIM 151385]|uniref:rhomboid family intramembrane serine protease n=1 Tax=Homoserinibacter sp. YIM 151385 TaxID=2985506 RepID=UPI0022F01BFA|nr:rhomboid family intramembrane serine protease [Homoserinibacter sp. YIM 151385]WBU38499.1 rhomboid family intramembrane serine protease [Homoserinibacter sp. YIM 151385]